MANTVFTFKSNTTSGVIPTPSGLQIGEGALNTGDGKLYVKVANAAVVQVSPQGGSNTQVQFNDSTFPGGSSGLTFDKSSNNAFVGNTLTVGTTVANSTVIHVGNSTVNAVSNSTTIRLANSTSSVTLSVPSAAAVSNNNFYMNANGSWSRIVHVGTTAPSSPATGDLWVDTN